jgi:hypothetical protein
LAALALGTSAWAANKDVITVGKQGVTVVTQAKSSGKTSAVKRNTSGSQLIYDNFAYTYPNGLYWCCYGGLIAGPQSAYGREVWQAAGFTPTQSLTITSVSLSLMYQSGNTTDVLVSINADNNGQPGTVLQQWQESGFPTFGDCCVVTTNTGVSVPVTAGTPYWVVVSTESTSDFQGAWGFDVKDQIDQVPNAYYIGGQWYPFAASMNFAVGVYGQ